MVTGSEAALTPGTIPYRALIQVANGLLITTRLLDGWLAFALEGPSAHQTEGKAECVILIKSTQDMPVLIAENFVEQSHCLVNSHSRPVGALSSCFVVNTLASGANRVEVAQKLGLAYLKSRTSARASSAPLHLL